MISFLYWAQIGLLCVAAFAWVMVVVHAVLLRRDLRRLRRRARR
jgi:hypothetical protein